MAVRTISQDSKAVTSEPAAAGATTAPQRRGRRLRHLLLGEPYLWWVLIVVVVLAGWQWVPQMAGASSRYPFLDPFFVSSPSRVATELKSMLGSGAPGAPSIWAPLERTLVTALVGTLAAIVVGAIGGLLCSNWLLLNRVARPFLVFLNALPKVALIPIIVLIAGSSASSDAATAFLVVLFLVFFNAYEGGCSVPEAILQNAEVLGAPSIDKMVRVRFPFVLAWTFAVLPNAISFGLVGTVTAELFTGSSGIGNVLIVALSTSNADLTFAVVVLLSVVGVLLVLLTDLLRRRVLHWW